MTDGGRKPPPRKTQKSFGWVLTVEEEVKADANTTWNVLTDIASSPNILSCVKSITFPTTVRDRHGKAREGLKWIEERDYFGHLYLLYKTITKLEIARSGGVRKSKGNSIKVAVSMEDKYHSVVHTTTMTVLPGTCTGNKTKSNDKKITSNGDIENSSSSRSAASSSSCRIVGTYAVQYNWYNRLKDILTFGFRRKAKARQFFEHELLEYASEAENRFRVLTISN